mmetsp:Transcript_56765/g.124471  ORF Transcript_56765/g.124471 Transcript_56765/m.124471 type:complete len:552 (+) Transcript_56765:59-1714(+)
MMVLDELSMLFAEDAAGEHHGSRSRPPEWTPAGSSLAPVSARVSKSHLAPGGLLTGSTSTIGPALSARPSSTRVPDSGTRSRGTPRSGRGRRRAESGRQLPGCAAEVLAPVPRLRVQPSVGNVGEVDAPFPTGAKTAMSLHNMEALVEGWKQQKAKFTDVLDDRCKELNKVMQQVRDLEASEAKLTAEIQAEVARQQALERSHFQEANAWRKRNEELRVANLMMERDIKAMQRRMVALNAVYHPPEKPVEVQRRPPSHPPEPQKKLSVPGRKNRLKELLQQRMEEELGAEVPKSSGKKRKGKLSIVVDLENDDDDSGIAVEQGHEDGNDKDRSRELVVPASVASSTTTLLATPGLPAATPLAAAATPRPLRRQISVAGTPSANPRASAMRKATEVFNSSPSGIGMGDASPTVKRVSMMPGASEPQSPQRKKPMSFRQRLRTKSRHGAAMQVASSAGPSPERTQQDQTEPDDPCPFCLGDGNLKSGTCTLCDGAGVDTGADPCLYSATCDLMKSLDAHPAAKCLLNSFLNERKSMERAAGEMQARADARKLL